MKTKRSLTTRPGAPRIRAVAGFIALLVLSGCVASRAFKEGEQEEAREHWDLAVLNYQNAIDQEPDNTRYRIALERARQRAAQVHYERGKLHRQAGQLDMAQVELEQSVALDATNDSAQQELKRCLADVEERRIQIEGGTPVERAKAKARGSRPTPPMLNPSSTKPISVNFPQDTPIKKIYSYLASAAGINIIYDPQLKDDKFTIEIRDMSFQKALETVMRQAGHFYKVIDEKTILVAQDTNQNRKEYEDLVIRTFFLSNGDIKDVSAMVRSLLDLRRLGTIPQLNAIVIRDTADKVAVAEKIIEVNDKAKSEVVVDVELLQLDTSSLINLGTQLSPYSVNAVYKGQPVVLPGGGTSTNSGANFQGTLITWDQLIHLSVQDFAFTVPAFSFSFIKQNSDAEVLAKPQLRIAEGEKAQLVIGDRVPIPVTTVNTTQAIGQVGVVPITSFQYQDVGIKIDLEPRVHHNKEVTLKLTVEVSNLNGKVTGPNGQDQPIIGTRTITSTIRLKDGETNILAGLIRKDTQKTRKTIPFLGDLPLIGSLFTYRDDQSKRTDLFLTLTPHIIRAPQITEDDLIPIWVGTENNVSFSGMNTRLESPTATGSPFETGTTRPAAVPQRPTPGPARTPASFGIQQGGAPRDPFRDRFAPAPQNTPAPAVPMPPPESEQQIQRQDDLSDAGSGSSAPVAVTASSGPVLALQGSTEHLAPGETGTIALTALSGLQDVGALELTVEWDAGVVEVNGVAPGPWRDADPDTRFEADRSPGRVRLQLGRPLGTYGMPDGVLASLSVKAVGEGTTLFRVSAGAASAKSGAQQPTVEAAAVTVRR